mgnify:CR=1 FL=1
MNIARIIPNILEIFSFIINENDNFKDKEKENKNTKENESD